MGEPAGPGDGVEVAGKEKRIVIWFEKQTRSKIGRGGKSCVHVNTQPSRCLKNSELLISILERPAGHMPPLFSLLGPRDPNLYSKSL